MIPTSSATLGFSSSELFEAPTPEHLKQAVLRHEQAAVATRLEQQVKLAERNRLTPTSTMRDDEVKVIDLPQFTPMPGHPLESFGALQEWEGVVVDVDDSFFYASLIDVSANGRTIEETAQIPLEEISDEDRPRVLRGAIFRWVIGYVRKASGTKMRGSVIYFRRTTDVTKVPEVIPPLLFERPHG